jgi:putative addiction module component (TIGR02574 family)
MHSSQHHAACGGPRILSRIEKIKEEIFQLPSNERALLAEQLINSLDEEAEDPEAERRWIEEANRRYQAYKEGKVKGIPSNQVFEEARSRFV